MPETINANASVIIDSTYAAIAVALTGVFYVEQTYQNWCYIISDTYNDGGRVLFFRYEFALSVLQIQSLV